MSKKKRMSHEGGSTRSYMDFEGQKLDIKSIMKDIEFIGSSHMTWKEKKDLENRKVVALGGKAPKKQRLPLSVARVPMKKQKEREQKMLQENMILGRFGGNLGIGGTRKATEKRKVDNKVLKSTEGNFKNGVLDVKHLLQSSTPEERISRGANIFSERKKTKGVGGKKNRGKKKKGGGGKKRH